MADIKSLTKEHMIGLLLAYDDLASKKAYLLDAAFQIAAINTQQSDLVTEAQAILARYNTQFGTNFTLAQLRVQLFG